MVKEKPTLYISPQVKVVEIKTQAIICQSNPNGTEQYETDIWE